MRPTPFAIAAAALALAAGLAVAQPANPSANRGPKGPPPGDDMLDILGGPENAPPREPGQRRAPRLSEFAKTVLDADADGRVTPEEREAGKDKAKAYHAKLIAAFDADKNGALSDQEWAALVPDAPGFGNADRLPRRDGQPPAGDRPAAGPGGPGGPGGPIGPGGPGGDGRQGFGPGPAIPGTEDLRDRALELFDKDGDGTLSDDERAALRAEMTLRTRVHAMEMADANADATLDETEITALRDAAKRLAERRGQPGGRGRGGQRPGVTPDI